MVRDRSSRRERRTYIGFLTQPGHVKLVLSDIKRRLMRWWPTSDQFLIRRSGLVDESCKMSVNVSGRQLDDPQFPDHVLGAVAVSGLPGPVLHLDGYPGPAYDGVPGIGEHTAGILTELLGLGPAELGELAGQNVISKPDGPNGPA